MHLSASLDLGSQGQCATIKDAHYRQATANLKLSAVVIPIQKFVVTILPKSNVHLYDRTISVKRRLDPGPKFIRI